MSFTKEFLKSINKRIYGPLSNNVKGVKSLEELLKLTCDAFYDQGSIVVSIGIIAKRSLTFFIVYCVQTSIVY